MTIRDSGQDGSTRYLSGVWKRVLTSASTIWDRASASVCARAIGARRSEDSAREAGGVGEGMSRSVEVRFAGGLVWRAKVFANLTSLPVFPTCSA